MNQLLDADLAGQAVPGIPGNACADPEAGAGVDVLKRELDKWRERVPRLVAALRERSDEVERLRAELASLRDAPAVSDGGSVQPPASEVPLPREGARAREAVIAELERELESLREANAGLQGAVHARSLTIGGLKRDLQGWKGKWQDLARRLDGLAGAAVAEDGRVAEFALANGQLTQELAELRRVVAELTEERDALQARNADLFETTGFASRQMEVLADDLGELRGQIKALRGEHENALGACSALGSERETLAAAVQEARAEVEALDLLLQSLHAPALTADLERMVAHAAELEAARSAADRARDAAEQARADAECDRARTETARAAAEAACAIARQARGAAEEARARAEAEAQEARAVLASVEQQVAVRQARQQQLEHQLEERSALVRSLEQERIERDRRFEQIEAERRELEEAQLRTDRQARENAEYIQQIDGRLERQKDLLLSLEAELAAAQQTHAEGVRQHEAEIAAHEAVIRSLQLQAATLQSRLQERRSESGGPADQAATEPMPGEPAIVDAVRVERDNRTLRVLNQQLKDARARNDELLQRIREFEMHTLATGDGAPDDDLTRIRGVGARLAQHLRTLGVRSYQQIAELDAQALDDPAHALAPLKSRILRDGWIEQAASLFRH